MEGDCFSEELVQHMDKNGMIKLFEICDLLEIPKVCDRRIKSEPKDMLVKNSAVWFLNSHRQTTLEKILATYLSNYREFLEVLQTFEDNSIYHQCIFIDTSERSFSQVL
jgi:hypothetical protein